MRPIPALLALGLTLMAVLPAEAQWQRVGGPEGGTINQMVARGKDTLYAATEGGLYRSLDAGLTWSDIGAGLPETGIRFVHKEGRTLYARLKWLLYASEDEGAHWRRTNSGESSYGWVVGHGGEIFMEEGSRILGSRDQGNTWDTLHPGFSGSMVCAAAGESRILICDFNDIYFTGDRGKTWRAAGKDKQMGRVNQVLLDGSLGWAATDAGLFQSRDAGASWKRKALPDEAGASGLDSILQCLARAPGVLYAARANGSILRSLDDGATWTAYHGKDPEASMKSLAVHPEGLLAGTSARGMLLYKGSAAAPLPRNRGIWAVSVPRMVAGSKALVIGTRGGTKENGSLFRTLDGGATWESAEARGLTGEAWRTVTMARAGSRLFAYVGSGQWTIESGRLLQSDDDGSTWTPNPAGPKAGWGAVGAQGDTVFATLENGVFHRSVDRGETWTPAESQPPGFQPYVFAAQGSTVLAEGAGYYVSRDGGRTWKTERTSEMHWSGSLARFGNAILHGGSAQVVLSTDGGLTWNPYQEGLPDIPSGGAIAVDGDLAALASEYHGVHIRRAGESRWTEFNEGLRSLTVLDLAIHGGWLYAGTASGVWKRRLPVPTMVLKAEKGRIRGTAASRFESVLGWNLPSSHRDAVVGADGRHLRLREN